MTLDVWLDVWIVVSLSAALGQSRVSAGLLSIVTRVFNYSS